MYLLRHPCQFMVKEVLPQEREHPKGIYSFSLISSNRLFLLFSCSVVSVSCSVSVSSCSNTHLTAMVFHAYILFLSFDSLLSLSGIVLVVHLLSVTDAESSLCFWADFEVVSTSFFCDRLHCDDIGVSLFVGIERGPSVLLWL